MIYNIFWEEQIIKTLSQGNSMAFHENPIEIKEFQGDSNKR